METKQKYRGKTIASKYDIKMPELEIWQKVVFDDIARYTSDIYVVKARRQCGKSILGITILLYKSFKFNNTISVMVEPTIAQCRRVYKQLLKAIGGEGAEIVKSANATTLEIEFVNGSQIIFKSAEQREALRGLTVRKGILIIDEAAFIQQDIFEILYPIVDANKCPILMISTPLFMSGTFYERYMEGLENKDMIRSYDWSTYDTSKYLSIEKLEYYRQTLSPLKFLSEYLGQFIAEGSYVFGKITTAKYSTLPAVWAGLDWGTGAEGDYTVLVCLDINGNPTAIYRTNNLTPTQQIDWIIGILNTLSIQCLQVEMNSIGAVYCDMLQGRTPVYISKFTTTNESKRTIIEQLISAVQTGAITIPDNPELVLQLQHYNIEKTKTGYTYNGADGVHDDIVMALAFAYDAYLNNYGQFSLGFA